MSVTESHTVEIVLYLGTAEVFRGQYDIDPAHLTKEPSEVARLFLEDMNTIYTIPPSVRVLDVPRDATEIDVVLDGVTYAFPVVVTSRPHIDFLS